MDPGKLYGDLFAAYKKAMDGKSAREAQEAANLTWNKFKKSETDKHKLECAVKDKIVELESKARQKKASLMSYWCRIPVKKRTTDSSTPSSLKSERIEVAPG